MFSKVKVKIVDDWDTVHFTFEIPDEHYVVVIPEFVVELVVILIYIDSLSLGEDVLGSNAREFKGEIASVAFF